MIRAVIDTNCLRSSIPPKSPFSQLYADFIAKKFEWFVSTEILLEHDEIITKTYSANISSKIIYELISATNIVFREPSFKWNLVVNDPDDNKFSDLAISANCDYLVSNDRDFDVFKKLLFPRLKVVTLQTFLNILSEPI